MTEIAAKYSTLTGTLNWPPVAILTLSALSPLASVLVGGDQIVALGGDASLLAFVIGGIIILIATQAQAQLGEVFPQAGGDFGTVSVVLGRPIGFVIFILALFSVPVFIALTAEACATVIATLTGIPLGVFGPAAIVTLAALIAAMKLPKAMIVVLPVLLIELVFLSFIAIVGIASPQRTLSSLAVAPQANISSFASAVAAVVWLMSGAGQAVFLSEELRVPRKVGQIVRYIAVIALGFMVAAIVGALLAAPSLDSNAVSGSINLVSRGRMWAPAVVLIALFAAMIALLSCYGRMLWASARDDFLPDFVSIPILQLRTNPNDPAIAILLMALIAIVFSFLRSEALISFAGACGGLIFLTVNVAALFARYRGLLAQTSLGRTFINWSATFALIIFIMLSVVEDGPGRVGIISALFVALTTLTFYKLRFSAVDH